MFTFYFVAFCFVLGLSFILLFILHLLCIILIVRTFIFCPHFSLTTLSIRVKKGGGGEYTLE